jgi:steroid 5-alpha reductase family enzyme
MHFLNKFPSVSAIWNDQLAGTLLELMVVVALLCFLTGEITRNYSQVDKLWSLMPVIYSIIALIHVPSPRLLIMSLLVSLWGFRLSYNFYRKGGYHIIPWKGQEDYRWKILREHKALRGRFRFGLFNLLFISSYQHLLIFLFSSPLLVAAANSMTPLGPLDFVASCLMLTFIAIETVADNQQFRFQMLKKNREKNNKVFSESLVNGFLSEGLWKYVRHPNFAAEQAIWVSFYLFGVAASGRWINWSLAGSVLLILLFRGSTLMTEGISRSRYREYDSYRKMVPAFIPRLNLRNNH